MSKKVGPISPNEVCSQAKANFPSAVFEVFNDLIAANWNGISATIRQDEVVKRLVAKGLERNEIFDKGWLNVEEAYRSKGWRVEYDKPGYNETYEATFTFRRKGSR